MPVSCSPRPPGSLGSRDYTSDLAAVGLELDRPASEEGLRAIPEVLHRGVVDDPLTVQVDRRPRADLEDAETVPFAERPVGQDERVPAGGPEAIVEEAARALIGPAIPLAPLLGRVPDLHLRSAPEIDAAVGLGDGLVVDLQLDVAVILVRGQIGPLAVIDQFAALDSPVRLGVVRPLGQLLRLLLVVHGGKLTRVEMGHAVPAGEALAIEQGDETRRGELVIFLGPSGRPKTTNRWTAATATKAGIRIGTGAPRGSGFERPGEPGAGGPIAHRRLPDHEANISSIGPCPSSTSFMVLPSTGTSIFR